MDFTLRGSSERAAQPPPWGEQLLIPIFPSSTLPYWWLPWETHFKNIQICSDTFTHDFLVAWKHLFWGSCSTDPTLVTEYNSFCNTVLSISFILLLLNHYSWVLQIDTSAALENKEKSNQALHHREFTMLNHSTSYHLFENLMWVPALTSSTISSIYTIYWLEGAITLHFYHISQARIWELYATNSVRAPVKSANITPA